MWRNLAGRSVNSPHKLESQQNHFLQNLKLKLDTSEQQMIFIVLTLESTLALGGEYDCLFSFQISSTRFVLNFFNSLKLAPSPAKAWQSLR